MNRNSARISPLARRRHIAAVVALGAVSAGMLAACGTPDNGPGGTVTVSATASTSAGGSVGDQLAGDVGYFRAGGIAGFNDQLTVSTDGVAVLARRGSEVVRCKVKPAPLAQLAQLQAAAAKSIPSPSAGPRKMPAAHPDQMTVGVVVGGTRVPSTQLSSSPPEWRTLFEQMSNLFEDAVALSPGQTASPNSSARMCDPI